MGGDDLHRQRITACLRALRPDPTILRYEVLQGGISGASTYQVELTSERVVLKIADGASSRDVLERAHRERRFYHGLSSLIPLRLPTFLGAVTDASASRLCLAAYQPVPKGA
jgi:hypothetical protein